MRKLGATLATAAAMLGIAASTASAGVPPTTIGPANLSQTINGTSHGNQLVANLTSDGTNSYAVPEDGTITSFSANLECPATCFSRLIVMRAVTPPTYEVIVASASAPGVPGVNTFTVNLPVLQGDVLALETTGGFNMAGQAGSTNVAKNAIYTGGSTFTFNDAFGDEVFLFNAQLETPVATSVSVDRPSTANAGDAVAYVAHVDRNTGSDRSVIGGTVSFDQDGIPIAACQSVPVTAGDATCTTTVSPVAGRHSIQVSYSGDSPFEPTTGSGSLNVRQATTTTAGTQDPGPFDPSSAITFTATVTPPPSASFAVSTGILQQLLDRGKAAFSVDGVPVEACGARLVDAVTGVATCATTAPADGRDHVVKAVYSGGTFYLGSEGEGPFQLKLPEAPVPPAPPAPTPPVPPAPTAPPVTTIPPVAGAVFAPGQPTALPASGTSVPSVTVPLRCPDAQECSVDGTVTTSTSGTARTASAAQVTATVARFSRVHIAGGEVKKLKLRLDPAFVRKASKQGVRRIKATLTVNTTLGSGAKVTTHQKVTIVLPKAKRKAAAPHFTG